MDRIAQFEHHFDFTRYAILKPATNRAGHAGRVLSKVYETRDRSGISALFSHRVATTPYYVHATSRKTDDRIDQYTFLWRGRRYWICVHSDRTALLTSTTKDGFDLCFVPIVFEIPENLTLLGNPRGTQATVRLATDFNNALLGRAVTNSGPDWMRPSIPLLRNDRAGFCSAEFELRKLFRNHLVAEAKHIFKTIEAAERTLIPHTPWWGNSTKPSQEAQDWLRELLKLGGEYFRIKTGHTRNITLTLTGRVVTAQGFLSHPKLNVALPTGAPQQDPNKVLGWLLDTLDREDTPMPPFRQVFQEHGRPLELLSVLLQTREPVTAHEAIEITAQAHNHAA